MEQGGDERERLRRQRLGEESAQSSQERRQRFYKLLGVAIGAAVLAVVVLIVVNQSGDKGGDTSIEGGEVPELAGLEQSGDTVGDPAAAVTVVEFGDLQCPVCKQYSQTVIPELLSGPVSSGQAKLQFRNWTIIGPDSITAAKAALAAGEQDRMWTFVELFYANQGPENGGYVTDEFLTAIAEQSGLDVDRWNQDRADARWDAELKRIDREATSLGFTGTPSVLVSGPGGDKPFLGDVAPTSAEIEDAIVQLGG